MTFLICPQQNDIGSSTTPQQNIWARQYLLMDAIITLLYHACDRETGVLCIYYCMLPSLRSLGVDFTILKQFC